jgi:DNA-binding IclR family transcriptional regulator
MVMPIVSTAATLPEMKSKLEGRYQLQSLERAVSVLEMLGECDTPLSLAEICRRMQMHKSTVHRSLMVLERSLLIERTQDDRFRLGLKLYELGSRAVEQVDLRARIRPILRQLSTQIGETVHLGVLHKTSVIYLDKAEPNRRICMSSKTGGSNPVYCTSMGKAMLAFLPPEAAEQIIKRIHFVRYTAKTLCSREELLKALDRVRQRGYSVDDEEIELGVRCVGAPVFNQNHMPIAAVSISGPSSRLRAQNVPATAQLLMRCCSEISRSLQTRRKKSPRPPSLLF